MVEARAWIERLRPAVPLPRCPGLSPDEKLVVAAIRQMVIDGLEAPGAERVMAQKPGSEPAMAALRAWLGLLAANAARQIAVGAPGHCCASPDELAMLTVIDGARRGDFELVHAILAGLVRAGLVDAVAHASEVLGDRLTATGFTLMPRRPGRSPQPLAP